MSPLLLRPLSIFFPGTCMLLRDLADPETFLRSVPKAELHLHLDGSIRTSTILSLASELGVALPTTDPDRLDALLQPGEHCESLEQYLEAFAITTAVLRTEGAVERVAFEIVEDAHADGVTYLEVRYSPLFMMDHGLSMEATVRAVARGFARGQAAFGVVARQIICAMRDRAPEVTHALARDAARIGESAAIAAFDLAGAEAPFPPEAHAAGFLSAREGLLRATVHAGEAAGPPSIANAIHRLGAERLGHGVTLREDDALRAYVRDRGILVEACPTSNVQTRAVASFADHPALAFLREGLRVTLCTDNTGVSATTLTQEYLRIARASDLRVDEARTMILHAFDAAFAPREQRERLRQAAAERFDAELSARVG